MNKVLGILGGMGPEATVDLFSKIVKLTPAQKDQDHIHILIDNYPQIPDRTGFILRGGENPAPYLIEGARRLEKAGADALLMPCNTAHYFIPEISKHINIPFISMVDSAVDTLKKDYPGAKKIIPISTTGTKATRIYEDALIKAGYTLIDLPEGVMDKIMYAIYEGVKKGKTDDVVDLFQETLISIAGFNPDALIAACTEIPILMQYVTSPVPIIDATESLAKAGVLFAKGSIL